MKAWRTKAKKVINACRRVAYWINRYEGKLFPPFRAYEQLSGCGLCVLLYFYEFVGELSLISCPMWLFWVCEKLWKLIVVWESVFDYDKLVFLSFKLNWMKFMKLMMNDVKFMFYLLVMTLGMWKMMKSCCYVKSYVWLSYV